MRRFKAVVANSLDSFDVEVRLAEVYEDHMNVASDIGPNGRPTMTRTPPGAEVPPILSLPREAIEAIRDALNGYAPPRDDGDLREALTVERSRVDRIIAAHLDRSRD